MSDEFEDSKDPGHTDQTEDLAGLADDVELGEVINQEGDKVGQDGKQVDLQGVNSEKNVKGAVHKWRIAICGRGFTFLWHFI